MRISHEASSDQTVATKPWSNHSGEPIVWRDEEKRRSPRVAWGERLVRERYSKSRFLDVGFVGTYREPFLHFAIRRQNPKAQILGVDINVEEILKKRLSNAVGARAESMAFKDRSFEVVLCLELLEHLYSPMNVLLELWRVLRPGGDLILTTPNAWSCWNFARH
jgi:2-polyprenyl-3-methyl-5-hydroxy-6-metoxy-1,4-benzoquinol methylase